MPGAPTRQRQRQRRCQGFNHQGAMDVLNAASTTLKQYDRQRDCALVDPPVAVPPAKSQVVGSTAEEAARIAITES